ncbi:MAG: CdaR family protein [Acidobacteriota bacterium]
MKGRLHIPVLLLSLVLAVAIKIAVHEGEQMTETVIDARASYPVLDDENRVIVLDPRQSVSVRLRGRSSEIAALNPFSVEAVIEIPPGTTGLFEVTLEPSNIRVAGDIEVVSIEPNRFSVEVESLVRKIVPLTVEVSGEPAAGALVESPTLRPARVQVEGPVSKLSVLDAVAVSVSVDRRAMTFEEEVQIIAPDPLIQILEPKRVVVSIPMRQPDLTPLDDTATEEEAADTDEPSTSS